MSLLDALKPSSEIEGGGISKNVKKMNKSLMLKLYNVKVVLDQILIILNQ